VTTRTKRDPVTAYTAALKRYHGNPPLGVWQKYTWQDRFAAVYRYCHGGRDRPASDLKW
jgi:hypothetical protein